MKLHYKKYGKGEPLIILHGLYGSSDNWVSIARKLESKFTVYLLDQRNHGQSPHSEIHNYDSMTEDLKEFMDDNSLNKAHILGHSMGGKTVMFFARKYSERVKSLIVVDISPFAYDIDFGKTHEYIISSLQNLDLSKFKTRNEIDKELSQKLQQKSLRNFLLKNVKRKEGKFFAWKLNIEAVQQNLKDILTGFSKDKLSEINIPTLFIKGQNSPYLDEHAFDEVKAVFPLSEFKIIADAGHWLHAEQPEAFLKTINEFSKKMLKN